MVVAVEAAQGKTERRSYPCAISAQPLKAHIYFFGSQKTQHTHTHTRAGMMAVEVLLESTKKIFFLKFERKKLLPSTFSGKKIYRKIQKKSRDKINIEKKSSVYLSELGWECSAETTDTRTHTKKNFPPCKQSFPHLRQ